MIQQCSVCFGDLSIKKEGVKVFVTTGSRVLHEFLKLQDVSDASK
jgi:hypothetical protein